VQLALDVADRSSAAQLAAGLQGAVAAAIKSPHANYVVQKIIKVLSPQEAPFIAAEMKIEGPELASHEYGCRVFCRLLENAAGDKSTARLVDIALLETDALLTHTYGHHVAECVLEHGLAHQRSQIVSALRKDIMRIAQSRTGAYVLEKALLYGSLEDQQLLASDLLGVAPREFAGLTRSQQGSMIVRTLLRLPPGVAEPVRRHLRSPALVALMETTKFGRRILASAGLGSTSSRCSSVCEEEEEQQQ